MINFLSPDNTNSGRQVELDIIKGLSILFMLLVHCFELFTAWPLQTGVSTYIIEFLGSPPAAPVFMFALGVGIVYSRKSTPKTLVSRGIRLIVLGYVLSFFRDFLPNWFLYVKTGQADKLNEAINLLIAVDILQFAGLAFLFFAAAAKLRFKGVHYMLSAFVFAAANLLVSGTVINLPAANIIAGLFWGTNEYSWFPFLTWIIYPVCGYLFGSILIRCTDKRSLYKTVLVGALPVLLVFTVYSFVAGVDFGQLDGLYQGTYYHHSVIGNIAMVAFVLCLTGAVYFMSERIPGVIKRAFSRWSKNITTIYCVHWLILGWSITVIELPLSLPWILLSFVALTAVSDFFSVYYLKLKSLAAERIRKGRAQTKPIQ